VLISLPAKAAGGDLAAEAEQAATLARIAEAESGEKRPQDT
jgi:hypothetical protein